MTWLLKTESSKDVAGSDCSFLVKICPDTLKGVRKKAQNLTLIQNCN
jgi:hypothetical protein